MAMIFSKRNTVLSLLLTFVAFWSLEAQSFNGKIISTQGGEAVPFANVMIQGSMTGVATNMDGEFAINVPRELQDRMLIISAVGYTNKEFPIEELGSNKLNIIAINTQEYHIDEVAVQADSKILYGAIKKCSRNVAENYITNPYSCDFVYTNNNKKAQGIITDVTGYQRTTFKGSFRKIKYKFTPNEEGKNTVPYFAGKTNMEDLLSFDLVRTVGNVIDEQNVYDFKLSLDPRNTDPELWVIHFANKTPRLYNTGDAHAESYEGELYIIKANYTIAKIVVRGKSSKRSAHGKSIAVTEKSSHYTTDHNYEVTTTYKAENGKYRMDKIQMSETYTNSTGKAQKVNSSLSITSQKSETIDIKGRDYYIKKF